MARRILLWAGVGFLVAICCAIYTLVVPITPAEMAFTLARVTQPVVILASYLHFGVSVGWVLLANTATYAMLGLAAESLRPNVVR